MAKGTAVVSLEPYKLTGVHVTDRELGTGSSATVIELEYMGLKCAGKKIHEILLKCGGSEYVKVTRRFSRECHFLSRINHPNIVQFYGVYFQQGVSIPILVMEFLPTDLQSCIEKHGVLPKEICYSIIRDIAQGLLYLHNQIPPIIHRDLSSNNILLTPILTAKIADLGVARIVNMSPLQVSSMTQTPGTLTYMPPEVMVAHPHYDTSIDEFSYGVLMIHILCGQSPEPHVAQTRNESGKLIAVSEAERRKEFLQVIGSDHPLMELILRCIDNEPKQRPSACEIMCQLKEKLPIVPPSFEQRLETVKYAADKEVKNRKERKGKEMSFKVKDGRKESKQRTNMVNIPTWSVWIAVIVPVIAVIFAYNAGRLNERKEFQTGRTTTKTWIQTGVEQQAQNFVNTTFEECMVNEKITCDKLVPTVIHNLGRISWTSGQDLQTSMYQAGQSVVINGTVYYGGGYATEEKHKYIVYCYHPRLATWTALKPLPVKSFGLGKFDGKVIAVGGWTEEGEASSQVYMFDEMAQSWMSTVIPSMQTSMIRPGVLSLPSALVVTSGRSLHIYTQETGWYWSDQPLPFSCTDVILTETGNTCFTIGGERFLTYWHWIYYDLPFSLYISTEDLLWDRNKTVPGMAYEYRDSIFPSYRWRKLPGGTKAYSLAATILAGNLVTLGRHGQRYDNQVRMYSLTSESWSRIGQLPENLNDVTITALSSTELFVIGKKQDGVLSVYRGLIQLFQ